MAAGPILLLALVAVVGGAIAYVAFRVDAKRRAALQAFAASNGWSYAATDDGLADRFRGAPFGTGDNRKVRNVLHGPRSGREMLAFDYSYTTSTTDGQGHRSTTTHRYAVCSLRLPVPLPGLELSPESALTRMASAVGLGDVELESEDFNRVYRVRARDQKFAYDVLHPRTMQALLSRRPLHLRLQDADALCIEKDRLTSMELLERLSTLELLVTGIPPFVWSDHSAGGARA